MKIIFKIPCSIDGQEEMVKYFYDSFEDSMKRSRNITKRKRT